MSCISFLKDLIPSFNECVDQFLERLRPLADGKTQVPMKEEFSTLTLNVISKVNWELCCRVYSTNTVKLFCRWHLVQILQRAFQTSL